MRKRLIFIPIILILAASAVLYWYLTSRKSDDAASALTGSGTVEATSVTISPETFGRIAEVLVNEGDQVNAGDTLLKLDATLLSAQLNQAQANLSAAQAGLTAAQDGVEAALAGQNTAQAQYDLALAQALQQAQPARASAWQGALPGEFEQPKWYFTQTEQMTAARDELTAAKAALEAEQNSFKDLMSTGAYAQLESIENSLALARAAFLDAQDVLDRAQLQDDQALMDSAQEAFDSASQELQAAQDAYNEQLTFQETVDLLDARARVAVAQERYDTAQDRANALQTGRDSLQVQVAGAAVTQAQTNVTLAESKLTQAQTAIDQAQAAIDLINVQLGKLVITTPVSGVVMARNVEPGEVIQPGASALTLGELQNLTITVYLPENRYGEVKLGDNAQVKVDSFPEQRFSASVTRIADQAEFTPRNVQTMEVRSTTVYAVQLAVSDPGGLLKPGMPADVTFNQP